MGVSGTWKGPTRDGPRPHPLRKVSSGEGTSSASLRRVRFRKRCLSLYYHLCTKHVLRTNPGTPAPSLEGSPPVSPTVSGRVCRGTSGPRAVVLARWSAPCRNEGRGVQPHTTRGLPKILPSKESIDLLLRDGSWAFRLEGGGRRRIERGKSKRTGVKETNRRKARAKEKMSGAEKGASGTGGRRRRRGEATDRQRSREPERGDRGGRKRDKFTYDFGLLIHLFMT